MPSNELALLANSEIDIEGRMPWSSNATYLVSLTCAGEMVGRAIYKPVRGERPLWDFEPGLHRRELAAYRLSEAMGIRLVPPTIIREGPLGEGSLQWFVNADQQQHYFTIVEQHTHLHEQLRQVAVFDLIANNTDRKSGHVLIDDNGHLWGIDHGLCFGAEFKLRTVVWEFGGEPIATELLAGAARIAQQVPLDIAALLADEEVAAVRERAQWVVDQAALPVDRSGRRYPWPLV
ncbi:MAG: SCO1664 family protein [Actinobacteria bacterium]|nr:SCO1664 family protein [Actinomycetota bacterium]